MQEKLKESVASYIDGIASGLLRVSHDLHAHPELAFEEFHACELLTATLEAYDLSPCGNVYTLETAFECEVSRGEDGPVVALLAEYDALPGIGHACGHNLIATASLGAALALAHIRDELPGTVRLLGTPAEEKGGGKEIMARAGAFEGVDASMMIHPLGRNMVTFPFVAYSQADVTYRGRAAHAAAAPHRGINALDGLLLAYQGISNLRQHIKSTERIHGIVTDGGLAANIVPDTAKGEFYVRAKDLDDLAALKQRVSGCFEAGAASSGAAVEIVWGEVDYLDLSAASRDVAQARAAARGLTNIAFHQAILKMSRCALLTDIADGLFIHMRSIRARTIGEDDRAARSIIDHLHIIEALEARDTELAERLVREHTLNLAKHVQQNVNYLD